MRVRSVHCDILISMVIDSVGTVNLIGTWSPSTNAPRSTKYYTASEQETILYVCCPLGVGRSLGRKLCAAAQVTSQSAAEQKSADHGRSSSPVGHRAEPTPRRTRQWGKDDRRRTVNRRPIVGFTRGPIDDRQTN
jgi:hypothetical protein